jgi:hypothetical protein
MANLWIVTSFLIIDLLIVMSLVAVALQSSWKPLEREFPAQLPSEPALSRRYQSFSIGWVNYGFSIHACIDDNYLHLTPIWFILRFGISPVSIPWAAIRPIRPIRQLGSFVKVNVGKQTICGPKWCFELVIRESELEKSD